jgi:UDP-N-acetylmuramoyl-tripeptide--D-alanyl-D-alanine ligase
MQILKGIKNSIIVDDTYNSSPIAVEAALKTIYGINANQRIAVLGMMNELGDYSKEAHERVGNFCNPQKLELVVTIGKDANQYLARCAEEKGCKVIKTDSPYEAARIVKENLKERAIILVKGSQNGVFSEETVKVLLANKKDVKNLVRQNDFWLKKKRAQFSDFVN